MTHKNNFALQPVEKPALVSRMAVGGGIALLLITLFLLRTGEPEPEWGKFWMIRPLILVPVAGGAGGALFYFVNHVHYPAAWMKWLAGIFSVLGYIIALWMGTVLGLDGTYWN